jgi:hypothetical protein
MTAGTKIKFTNSQLIKANGEWQVMRVWQDGQIFLGRLNSKGELLSANAKNMINLYASHIEAAIQTGTAQII